MGETFPFPLTSTSPYISIELHRVQWRIAFRLAPKMMLADTAVRNGAVSRKVSRRDMPMGTVSASKRAGNSLEYRTLCSTHKILNHWLEAALRSAGAMKVESSAFERALHTEDYSGVKVYPS